VPTSQLTSFDKQESASWLATSPWVLAASGTNITLTPCNAIASSGVWNDTEYHSPYKQTAAGGGGPCTSEKRPWWQPAISSQRTYRMVPDVAAFADASPGYVIICSPGVQGRGPSSGQTISYFGGTSAAAPLVAGMIGLWDQQAQQSGLPKPGFVAPLFYSIAHHTQDRSWTSPPGPTQSSAGCRAARRPRVRPGIGLGSPFGQLLSIAPLGKRSR
jgi:subtilase family serine protease